MTKKNEKQKMIDVLLIKPGRTPERRTIENRLDSLQDIVDGYIEIAYPFSERVGLIMNTDGKLEGLKPNRALYDDDGEIYDIVAGVFCITGLGDECLTSLSQELFETFEKRFYMPELFVMMDGKIYVFQYQEGDFDNVTKE